MILPYSFPFMYYLLTGILHLLNFFFTYWRLLLFLNIFLLFLLLMRGPTWALLPKLVEPVRYAFLQTAQIGFAVLLLLVLVRILLALLLILLILILLVFSPPKLLRLSRLSRPAVAITAVLYYLPSLLVLALLLQSLQGIARRSPLPLQGYQVPFDRNPLAITRVISPYRSYLDDAPTLKLLHILYYYGMSIYIAGYHDFVGGRLLKS